MKRANVLFMTMLIITSCGSIKNTKTSNNDVTGVYVLESNRLYQALTEMNYSNLEIYKDGTYTLNKSNTSFSNTIEQCDYASKGKWSLISKNVLEITSENYYNKQNGAEFSLNKENKFSQDSLYIQINLPPNDLPIEFNFIFNNDNSKSITTDKNLIALSKKMYLGDRITQLNHIGFVLYANVRGYDIYKSRTLFNVLNENIDTEKFNFLTISLPNFDRCYFEFEPYRQELIYLKGNNKLLWQGELWKRSSEK